MAGMEEEVGCVVEEVEEDEGFAPYVLYGVGDFYCLRHHFFPFYLLLKGVGESLNSEDWFSELKCICWIDAAAF